MKGKSSTWEITLNENERIVGQDHMQKVMSCRRRVFRPEEDKLLVQLVGEGKCKNWVEIASHLNGRTPRQCRDRWTNFLDPSNTFAPWTPEEDKLLVEKVNEYGTKWQTIKPFMPGRSDNCLKNRWYSGLKSRCMLGLDNKYVLKFPQTPSKKNTNLQQMQPIQLVQPYLFPQQYPSTIGNFIPMRIPEIPHNQVSMNPYFTSQYPYNPSPMIQPKIQKKKANQCQKNFPPKNIQQNSNNFMFINTSKNDSFIISDDQTNSTMNDDFLDRQILNQIQELEDDPFNIPDLMSEWF